MATIRTSARCSSTSATGTEALASAAYARIASTYDDLPVRHALGPEPALVDWSGPASPRVLDIGCGTGLWLARQAALPCAPRLAGVDPSAEMLARARVRLPDADLRVASAERLPFPDAVFDLVAMRFCHHHFADRRGALDELARVLSPGGTFVIENIDPVRMPGHWIFQRFPEARAIDGRYPDDGTLLSELRSAGLEATVSMRYTAGTIVLSEALRQARVRDQTHLVALDDAVFERGLAALTALAEGDPAGRLSTESCVVTLRGRPRF